MARTVVVVDDDPDTLEFLQLLLCMQGVHVVTVDHTGDVIDVIRDARPDVVLLDLQTPLDRRAGLGILAQFRADEATARVPVILMSADDAALTRHAAHLRELGARLLAKPFEPDHLCRMLEQAAA